MLETEILCFLISQGNMDMFLGVCVLICSPLIIHYPIKWFSWN